MKQTEATRHSKRHGCRRILLLSGVVFLLFCSACLLYGVIPDFYYSFPVQKLLEDVHLLSNIHNRANKESDMIAFSCEHGFREGSSLYSVYPDGSNLRLLRKSPSQSHVGLNWSPDGIWIAFNTRVSPYYYSLWNIRRIWTYDHYTPEIYRIRFDGSISRRMTYNNFAEWIPIWSNDGTHIFYASGGLRRLSANTGETKVISDQVFWIYDLTADGTTVALAHLRSGTSQSGTVRSAIYRMNSDGSGLHLIKRLEQDFSVNGMRWSPDGNHLLYHDSNGRPFVLDVNTLEEKHAPKIRTRRARWSPDSRRVAIVGEEGIYLEGFEWRRTSEYIDSPGGLKDNLYLLDVEQGDAQTIIEDVSPTGLSWSPDGEWLAFTTGKESQLFKIRPDGTDLQQLTDMNCRVVEISWSPK